jgi:hypothetical protein
MKATFYAALAALVAILTSFVPANAQLHKTVFQLVPNPKTIECLKDSSGQPPTATVKVVRGELNDTLQLEVHHFKPGLAFDLFTVQHSPFLADGTPDPAFTGSFGLAWYQTDVQVDKDTTDADDTVRIRTILLDQIFGFDADSDVNLKPTNTFHVGFWFNNPEDAAPCGFDVSKPTPFNGEHKAGPFAFISVPNKDTNLGPLCTNPDTSTNPPTCNP